MEDQKQLFTVSIYTENNIGLLNRISAIFQRRHINIESINTSVSEIEEVSKFTIVVNLSEEKVKKILGQIEKQVEVIKAYYHTDDETIYQESCMFKLIEKSGRKEEIELLYRELKPFGILQFTRSGRISVSKKPMKISQMLKAFNY